MAGGGDSAYVFQPSIDPQPLNTALSIPQGAVRQAAEEER
jgi:hypothetical protein